MEHGNAALTTNESERQMTSMTSMTLKIWLNSDRRERKDFTALKEPKIQEEHHQALVKSLQKTENPSNVSEKLRCLNDALLEAQSELPPKKTNPNRKWTTSKETLMLASTSRLAGSLDFRPFFSQRNCQIQT